MFTTNLFHAQPVEAVLEIGDYLRQYRGIKAWNVRMAVPVHHGDGERARSPARRRQLLGTRPSPALGLRYYQAILEAHADSEFPFDVRMGNYLMTSLLCNPAALTAFGGGHPCREDQYLVTVKATGDVTQCPILTEPAPDLTLGSGRDGVHLGDGFEADLPLAGLDTSTMKPTSTTDTSAIPVRTMVRSVGRTYQHANREVLIEGDLLPARLCRSRAARVS